MTPRSPLLRSRPGFTLIEVLGALAVGSLVFGFAACGIQGALESARVSAFNENLALLRMNIQEILASARNSGSMDLTESLIRAGAVPGSWLAGDEDRHIAHEFGGRVSVRAEGGGFAVTAESVPRSPCRRIAAAQHPVWDRLTVGGSAVSSLPAESCAEDRDGEGVNALTFSAR